MDFGLRIAPAYRTGRDYGLRIFKSPFAGLTLVSFFALLAFWFCFPTHFLIADELAYFDQALAFSNGQTSLLRCAPCDGSCQAYRPSDYPAGTSLLAASFIWMGGPKAVFWSSFFCWIAGTWALALTLQWNGKATHWAFFPWLFFPALALTRTVMSDLPGFLLAAVFMLLLTAYPKNRWAMFGAGLVGGISLLFRETNLLWVLPFSVGILLRKKTHCLWFWAGLLAGLLPRLFFSWLLFQSPFFIRDPGIAFSWSVLPANLIFYGLVLLVILPGGLWFWWKSKHPYQAEIGLCLALFLLVYSGYGYDAFAKSGYKGIFLQARFLIPLLPFFALAAAWSPLVPWQKLRIVLPAAALLLFAGVQVIGRAYNTGQQRFTDALLNLPTTTHISLSPDESRKYLNTVHGPSTILDGAALSDHALRCSDTWYVHLIARSESADRAKKAQAAQAAFLRHFKHWKMELHGQLAMTDGARLLIWKVQRLNHDD